jgi:hypothetical protein
MSTSTILGGIFRTLLAFAVIVPMATPLASQESSICSLVTLEDAATILGSSAKETKDGRGCIWEDATEKPELIVRAINIPSVLTQ